MKAIIHIGGEKTGTSTVQEFCAKNRTKLSDHGIIYPTSLGASNHLRLMAYALEDDAFDETGTRMFLGLKTPDQIEVFRKQLRAELAEEIAAAPSASTLLLSNEHLQSRLLKISETRRLGRLIRHFADEISIVLYMRRQDRLAVSYYSTRLKSDTFTDDAVFPTIVRHAPLPSYYDYNAVLARYEKAFGADNITVRVFDPDQFIGGDLICDFFDACGLPAPDETFARVERENESLSEIGLRFFKRFNPRVPRFSHGRLNPYRQGILSAIMKRYTGRGPVVSRQEAEAFYHKFNESNRDIQSRYFPDATGPLFDEDFSDYDDADCAAPSEDELLDLAVHLWVERSAAIDELRTENALLRFQSAVRDDPDVEPPALPEISLGGELPAFLSLRYLGALLYSDQMQRAVEVAQALLGAGTARPVLIVVLGFAMLALDDEAAYAALLADQANVPKLAKFLEAIRQGEVAQGPRRDWMAFFRSCEGANGQVYARCLAWLDH